MAMTIHVDIVSAEGQIHSGLAEMVYAPGVMGELGIAPRHTPLVTRLKPGEVRIEEKAGKPQAHYFISGGEIGAPNGGSRDSGEIAGWVASTFQGTQVGSITVYDLTAR